MDHAALIAVCAFAAAVVFGQNLLAYVMKVPLRTKATDPRVAWVYRFIGATTLALYIASGGVSMHWVPNDVRIFGIVLIGLAIALIFWSQITLGRNWVGGVGLHKGHRLVTWGPYSRVRHPIYSGYLLATVGIALASASLVAASGAAMLTCALLVRIFSEEQMLRKQFRKRHAAYCQYTGWLLPKFRGRA